VRQQAWALPRPTKAPFFKHATTELLAKKVASKSLPLAEFEAEPQPCLRPLPGRTACGRRRAAGCLRLPAGIAFRYCARRCGRDDAIPADASRLARCPARHRGLHGGPGRHRALRRARVRPRADGRAGAERRHAAAVLVRLGPGARARGLAWPRACAHPEPGARPRGARQPSGRHRLGAADPAALRRGAGAGLRPRRRPARSPSRPRPARRRRPGRWLRPGVRAVRGARGPGPRDRQPQCHPRRVPAGRSFRSVPGHPARRAVRRGAASPAHAAGRPRPRRLLQPRLSLRPDAGGRAGRAAGVRLRGAGPGRPRRAAPPGSRPQRAAACWPAGSPSARCA